MGDLCEKKWSFISESSEIALEREFATELCARALTLEIKLNVSVHVDNWEMRMLSHIHVICTTEIMKRQKLRQLWE